MNKIIYLQQNKPTADLPNTPKEDYDHFLKNKEQYPNVVEWQNQPEFVNDQHFYNSHLFHYEEGHHLPYTSPFKPEKPSNYIANRIGIFIIAMLLISSTGLQHLCIKGIQLPFMQMLSMGFYILAGLLGIHAVITMLDRRDYRSSPYRYHMNSQYKYKAFTLSLYSALCIMIPTYLKLWSAACML